MNIQMFNEFSFQTKKFHLTTVHYWCDDYFINIKFL